MSENNIKSYTLDYIGKYNFYDEDEFIKKVTDGEYILENIKKSNRFDYNEATYTFTKFGSISEGVTTKNVLVEIEPNNIDVKMNGENVHLDLIYKMDIKELEDHYRIATRISEKGGNSSLLLYINLKDGDEFIKALDEVREYQEKLFKN